MSRILLIVLLLSLPGIPRQSDFDDYLNDGIINLLRWDVVDPLSSSGIFCRGWRALDLYPLELVRPGVIPSGKSRGCIYLLDVTESDSQRIRPKKIPAGISACQAVGAI